MFRVDAKILRRSEGGSAAAHLAYRIRGVIHDDKLGRTFDFSRRPGLETSWMAAPAEAPWASDVSSFAMAIEAAETRKNSQLLRELTLSIPDELGAAAARELVERFVREELTARGMVSAVAMHAEVVELERDGDPQHRNRHAHVSSGFRKAEPEGFGKKEREWNRIETLVEWRAAWARMSNEALTTARVERRVDHRSHAARRVELLRQAEAMEEADRPWAARASWIEAEALDHPPLPHLPRDAFQLMRAGAGADHPAFGEAIRARLEAERLKRAAAARALQMARQMARDRARALEEELLAIERTEVAEAAAETAAREKERARADEQIASFIDRSRLFRSVHRRIIAPWQATLVWAGHEVRSPGPVEFDWEAREWTVREADPLVGGEGLDADWRALEAERVVALERGRATRAAARTAEAERAFEAWESVVAPIRERARAGLRLVLGPTPAGLEAVRRRAKERAYEREQVALGRRLIAEDAGRVVRWERAQDWRDLPHPDKWTTIPPGLTLMRMQGPETRPSATEVNIGFLWLAGRLGLTQPRAWWVEDRRWYIARTIKAVAAEPERRVALPAFGRSHTVVRTLAAWWADAVRLWGDRLREWRGEVEAETPRLEAEKERERAERLARAAPRPAEEPRSAPKRPEEDPWRPRGP